MRVLWFAVTPSMYAPSRMPHNGGSWIASLEALVRVIPDLNLGIAFEHSDTCFRVVNDGIIYYPINVWQSRWQRLKRKFFYQTEEKRIIPACLKIIEDFKPDIIHVFGSEWCFGLVIKYTDIPVVIHIQGSIPPYYNARFPPGYSSKDFFFYNGLRIRKIYNQFLADWFFKLRGLREERILAICRYYMGRTEWDKNLVKLYAPRAKYFHCEEALREYFISSSKTWQIHDRQHCIFVSTISSPLYKGSDVILKTAKLLTRISSIKFEWHVFGLTDIEIHEKKTKIKASEVNVKIRGTASGESLKDELLKADMFIHPSYIDNSPNSICEAQILGMPIISTDVGGISSIVKHRETGLLIPSNDPHMLASNIILLLHENELASSLGAKAREVALKRHDPQQIVEVLFSIYNKIIAEKN